MTMVIEGGTFTQNVYGAGTTIASNGDRTGDITIIIEGGTFGTDCSIIAGGKNAVFGDVNLIISGGDFSDSSAIYAGVDDSNKAITGNTTVTLSGIENGNDFASYTGILSGSGTEAAGKTGTGSGKGVWGTGTLVLEGYTADSLGMTLQDFDTISLTSKSNTVYLMG